MSPKRNPRVVILAGFALALLVLSVGFFPAFDAARRWTDRVVEERAARDFLPYSEYYDLTREVERAVRSPDPAVVRAAEPEARELLRLATSNALPLDYWNYGNAVHYSHLLLGRYALLLGDLSEARCRLLCAGDTPGSPQLCDYGPDMTLAEELLARGQSDTVLAYFGKCQVFWANRQKNRLLEWYGCVTEGTRPDFGKRSGLQRPSPPPAPSARKAA